MTNEKSSFLGNIKGFFKSKGCKAVLGVLGIFIAIVGMLASIGLIYLSTQFNDEIGTRTTSIENNIVSVIERVETSVEVASKIVLALSSPQQIRDTVDEVITDNVERLESLEDTMNSLNFGGRLDSAIEKVEKSITSLEKINSGVQGDTFLKDQFSQRVEKIQAELASTKERVQSNARNIRLITFYGTSAGTVLAVIFIIGEISLFKSSTRNLRTLKKAV